jgi:hypothetical protein
VCRGAAEPSWPTAEAQPDLQETQTTRNVMEDSTCNLHINSIIRDAQQLKYQCTGVHQNPCGQLLRIS